MGVDTEKTDIDIRASERGREIDEEKEKAEIEEAEKGACFSFNVLSDVLSNIYDVDTFSRIYFSPGSMAYWHKNDCNNILRKNVLFVYSSD